MSSTLLVAISTVRFWSTGRDGLVSFTPPIALRSSVETYEEGFYRALTFTSTARALTLKIDKKSRTKPLRIVIFRRRMDN